MISYKKALFLLIILFHILVSITGFWHDYNCGLEFSPICKRSDSPPANATVAPTVHPRGGCLQNWKKINSKVRGHFYFILS